METFRSTKLTATTADNKYKTTLIDGVCLSDQNARKLTLEEQSAVIRAKTVFSFGDFDQSKKILEKAGFIVEIF